MLFRLLAIFLAVSLLSPAAHALTRAQLSTTINTLENRLTAKQENIDTLSQRLQSYEERLLDAQEKLAKAQADVFDANAEVLAAAKVEGADAANLQSLAAKKLDLAHNAQESRQRRLEMTENKRQSLTQALNKAKTEASQLQGQLIELNKQLAQVRSAPIQPAPAPVQVKEKAPIEPPQSLPAPQLASVVPTPVVETDQPVKVAQTLSPEQERARAAMRALNEKIRGADLSGYQQYKGAEVQYKGGSEELEYLGNKQYYAEVILPQGINRLKIQSRTFRVDVPDDQHNNTFAIIYDATNRQKAEFSIFNRSLLED